jgi:hypothetical protein
VLPGGQQAAFVATAQPQEPPPGGPGLTWLLQPGM